MAKYAMRAAGSARRSVRVGIAKVCIAIGAVVSVMECSSLARGRYHFGYDSTAGRTMVLSDLFVKPAYVGVALIAKMLAHLRMDHRLTYVRVKQFGF